MNPALPQGRARDAIVAALLALAVVASYSSAFALKLGLPSAEWQPWFGRGLAVALATKGALFVLFRVHRGMWRYAGVGDLVATIQANGVASAVLLIVALVWPAPPWLVSVVAIDFAVSALLLTGLRVAPRLLQEILPSGTPSRATLVLGAGDAGEAVVRELKRDPSRALRPVAFVDDDPAKQGRCIHGVPVVGRIDAVRTIADEVGAETVLVAICGLPSERMREIRALVRATGLPIKRIPSMSEMLSGRAGIAELRDFTLEELLEREPVRTDHRPVDALVRGRTVLVTGAAGSIGSELSRQITEHGPRALVCVDVNENALFELEHELRGRAAPGTEIVPVLANVRDVEQMDETFDTHAPSIVFHAAAYKHVPVLEHHPDEAVRTNVHGTRTVARTAVAHGVERFVFVSTDKAVCPSSVMGTTKRVAELIVGELDETTDTQFTTLRFGNVLGSNGSVMQIFRRQIAQGGPVTVTHPEMRRYFMSIPEAVELVLYAAAMDEEGSTFVLDMGEQVRILDMAQHFIRMNGFEPGRDIEIVYTGLRPGEKLYEELWTEAERPVRTQHPGILRACREADRTTDLDRRVDTLIDWADEGALEQVVEHLRGLVPEFTGEPIGRPPRKKHRTVELKVLPGVGDTRVGQSAAIEASSGRSD